MAASLISDDNQIKSVLWTEVNNSNNPNYNFQYFILFFPHKPPGEEVRNDMQHAKKG